MIGHFVYNLFSYSGAAFQALKLASQIKSYRSVLFNIGTSKKIKFARKEGILIIDLPRNYWKRLVAIHTISKRLNIKVYHLHGYILTGIIPGILLGKTLILKSTMLGDDDLQAITSKGWIHRQILSRVSCVISISSPLEIQNQKVIDKYGYIIKHKKITNGIIIPDKACVKENVFIIVGVIAPRKRTLEGIEYFKKYYARHGSKLFVIGPNPNEMDLLEMNKEYFSECKSAASGCEGTIVFTGVLNKSELNAYYSKALAILLFSHKEGMPNCILEGMSFNCVPLLTPIKQIAYDIVKDGLEGFIIDDFSREIFLKEISNISYENRPYLRVGESFNLKKLALEHEENYRNCI